MMEHQDVPYETYIQETLSTLADPGLLLVAAGADGKPNTMTIGWGTIGIIWGKPIFAVLVRPSRYTYTLLGQSNSFTVCVPPRSLRKAVGFCGTRSGRDYDKFKECDMTPLPSTQVGAPGIAECLIVYECQIVHTNDVIPANLADEIKASAYPEGDFHHIFYGQILAVRAVPNAAELLAG
jgi:flavin reductase (DIM6/NTAB) family NADH-FMN oxidoreductase RutF